MWDGVTSVCSQLEGPERGDQGKAVYYKTKLEFEIH